jgi:ribosomal protein S18 acetylase RimI-like enzyme
MPEVRILKPGDEALLQNAAPGVFDNDVDQNLAVEFLNDPRHHLAVAIDDGRVVAMVSAVHYVHPDKKPQLWINEVSVSPPYQRQHLATAMLSALFELGKSLGCTEAWVLTDRQNAPAMRLYSSLGGMPQDSVMFTFSFETTRKGGHSGPK